MLSPPHFCIRMLVTEMFMKDTVVDQFFLSAQPISVFQVSIVCKS
jgi:hypothetical protein